ncbi:MAG: DUF4258 domain-containing protein [Candidatus Sumerlaeaceae bacterium]|nr:DUF4258 domain-containing protein [Candidatus Sumerlaeaceae bacterium]
MEFHYYIDPAAQVPHIHLHDVCEEEVEEVFLCTLDRYSDDRPGIEGVRIRFGQTESGRHLKIIYKRDPDRDHLFVITAYEMRGKTLAAFRRRKNRK